MPETSIEIPKTELIPATMIRVRADNPQEQSDAVFNNLVRSIQDNGFLDPLWVVKGQYVEGELVHTDDVYEIVSGAHRFKGGITLSMTSFPCVVLPPMDERKRIALMVAANATAGELNPKKFSELVRKIIEGGAVTDLAYEWYTDAKAFAKMYKEIRMGLPEDIKAKLPETADEIKTVDQLAKILNRLFTTYGDTLPYGFMMFDFGGKDSIWIKCDKELWKKLTLIRNYCVENETDINDVISSVLIQSDLKSVIIESEE